MPSPPAVDGLLIDSRGLDAALRRLTARSGPVVGWGSGSVFDYFHRLYPVRLDALIDNDARRWGEKRRGVEIVPPAHLERLGKPALVIIYSAAWPEIRAQAHGLGFHLSIPASALFADAGVRSRLAWSEKTAARRRGQRTPRPARTVVVQGPIVPGITARVLELSLALHPDNQVVLSTWADTPPALLDAVRPLADDVVLSVRPEHPGVQNRNAQIVSTRAGLARARELGARTVLKTRSDLAVLAPSVFDRAAWWLERIAASTPPDAGIRQRLVVPASFTRKYLLYHPSDMVMLGHVDDMTRYWSAPLDARGGHLLSPEWIGRSVMSVALEGNPTESYLGTAFCRTLGRSLRGTLEDSWAFYRDLFAVVDNDWFDLLWLKNLSIPDAALRGGVRETVGQAFWERLLARDPRLESDARAVDLEATTLGSFAGLSA
jgi:hypothetical protein